MQHAARALVTCALLAVLLGAPAPARAQSWQQVSDEDGLIVEMRAYAGSKVNEVRASAVFDVPAARVQALLGDFSRHPGVIPPTTLARRLDGDVWYMVIDPPWVARRDYCIRVSTFRNAEGGTVFAWVQTSDGCPPPQPRLVRMPENRGAWTVTPLGERRTRVSYQAHTDPGGALPAWIVNRSLARTMRDVFAALRTVSAR